MDATAELTETLAREDYTSRPGALIWFFRKSRDRWKRKHQDLKATVKGFKNQIAAVTKSREQWRLKAEQVSERVSALESEVKELRAQAAASVEKKRSEPGKRPAEAQRG
jgi:predicted  nucleic acid-binding Zn-ribbon protein